MITAIVARLSADATLATALPGGVHTGEAVGRISQQTTPTAFDANREIRPCVLVKAETATPWGPHAHSGRLYVVLYLYQRFGYDSIEAARKRCYSLLQKQQVAPADGTGCYEIVHANDLLGLEDQALGCSLLVCRYVATLMRRP